MSRPPRYTQPPIVSGRTRHPGHRSYDVAPVLDPGGGETARVLREAPAAPPTRRDIWTNRYTAASFPFTVDDGENKRVLPANPRRTYLLVQNKDGTNVMFIDFGKNPTPQSVQITAGGNYEFIGGSIKAGGGSPFVPKDDIYVRGTLNGQEGVVVEGIIQY